MSDKDTADDVFRTVMVALGPKPRDFQVSVYDKRLSDKERERLADHYDGKVLFADDDGDVEWVEHGSAVPWAMDRDDIEAVYRSDSRASMSVRGDRGIPVLGGFAQMEPDTWYHVTATWIEGSLESFKLERAEERR